MSKIVVVEIYDDEVVSAVGCETIEEAIERANTLLKEYAKRRGLLEMFEELVADERFSLATEELLLAFDSVRRWTAHIVVY